MSFDRRSVFLGQMRSSVPYFKDLFTVSADGVVQADPRISGVSLPEAQDTMLGLKTLRVWNSQEYQWPAGDVFRKFTQKYSRSQQPVQDDGHGFNKPFSSNFMSTDLDLEPAEVADDSKARDLVPWDEAASEIQLSTLLTDRAFERLSFYGHLVQQSGFWYTFRQSASPAKLSSPGWRTELSAGYYNSGGYSWISGERGCYVYTPNVVRKMSGTLNATPHKWGTGPGSAAHQYNPVVRSAISASSWISSLVFDLTRDSKPLSVTKQVAAYLDVPVVGVASALPAGETIIPSGAIITPGTKIFSPAGNYFLTLQTDGNIVLYHSSGTVKWSPNTSGTGGTQLIMQTDGNLVLYTASWGVRFASGTHGNPGAYATVSNAGVLRFYTASGVSMMAYGSASADSTVEEGLHVIRFLLKNTPPDLAADLKKLTDLKCPPGLGCHVAASSDGVTWGNPYSKVSLPTKLSVENGLLVARFTAYPSGIPDPAAITAIRIAYDVRNMMTGHVIEVQGATSSRLTDTVAPAQDIVVLANYNGTETGWYWRTLGNRFQTLSSDCAIISSDISVDEAYAYRVTATVPQSTYMKYGYNPPAFGGPGCYAVDLQTYGMEQWGVSVSGHGYYTAGTDQTISFVFSDGSIVCPQFPLGSLYLGPDPTYSGGVKMLRTMRTLLDTISARSDASKCSSIIAGLYTKTATYHLDDGRVAIYDCLQAPLDSGFTEKSLLLTLKAWSAYHLKYLDTATIEDLRFGWVASRKYTQISGPRYGGGEDLSVPGYPADQYWNPEYQNAGSVRIVWPQGSKHPSIGGWRMAMGLDTTRYSYYSEAYLTSGNLYEAPGYRFNCFASYGGASNYKYSLSAIDWFWTVCASFSVKDTENKVYIPDISGRWYNPKTGHSASVPECCVVGSYAPNAPIVGWSSQEQNPFADLWNTVDTVGIPEYRSPQGYTWDTAGSVAYGDTKYRMDTAVGELSDAALVYEYHIPNVTSYPYLHGPDLNWLQQGLKGCYPDGVVVAYNGTPLHDFAVNSFKGTGSISAKPSLAVRCFNHSTTKFLTSKGIWESHLGPARRVTYTWDQGPLALLLTAGRIALNITTDRWLRDEQYPGNNTWDTTTSRQNVMTSQNVFVAFVGVGCKMVHAGGDVTTSFNEDETVGFVSGDTYTPLKEGWDRITVVDSVNKLPVCLTVMVCQPGCLPVGDVGAVTSGSRYGAEYNTNSGANNYLSMWAGVFSRASGAASSKIVGPVPWEDLPATSYLMESATIAKYSSMTVRFLGLMSCTVVGSAFVIQPPDPASGAAGSGHGPLDGTDDWGCEVLQSASETSADFNTRRPLATSKVVRSGRGWVLDMADGDPLDLRSGFRIGFRVFNKSTGIFQIVASGNTKALPKSSAKYAVQPPANMGYSLVGAVAQPPRTPQLPASAAPGTVVSV